MIFVKPLIYENSQSATQQRGKVNTNRSQGQLQLLLSAPVYNSVGQLQYALTVRAALHQKESDRPGLLAGDTIVIDQDGTILAHPIADRVGRHIAREADAERLKSILRNAIAGRKRFSPLVFLIKMVRNCLQAITSFPVQLPTSQIDTGSF